MRLYQQIVIAPTDYGNACIVARLDYQQSRWVTQLLR